MKNIFFVIFSSFYFSFATAFSLDVNVTNSYADYSGFVKVRVNKFIGSYDVWVSPDIKLHNPYIGTVSELSASYQSVEIDAGLYGGGHRPVFSGTCNTYNLQTIIIRGHINGTSGLLNDQGNHKDVVVCKYADA